MIRGSVTRKMRAKQVTILFMLHSRRGRRAACSWCVFSVAQICNLLYRRISFCGTSASASALELSDTLPITNRRYGRLQICATTPRLCAKHLPKLRRDGAQVKADARRFAGLTQIEMNPKKEFGKGPTLRVRAHRIGCHKAVFTGACSGTARVCFPTLDWLKLMPLVPITFIDRSHHSWSNEIQLEYGKNRDDPAGKFRPPSLAMDLRG